jgi:hypothetical protein
MQLIDSKLGNEEQQDRRENSALAALRQTKEQSMAQKVVARKAADEAAALKAQAQRQAEQKVHVCVCVCVFYALHIF